MRIDLARVLYRLLDGLPGLARKPHDEGSMDGDSQFAAVLGELSGELEADSFLDIVQDLLIAGFVAHEQQPQAVIPQHLERVARNIRLGVAGPGHAQLAELLGDGLGARRVVSERIVIKKELADLGKCLLRPGNLLSHMTNAAGPIAMPPHSLRPQAERAARLAAASCIE